MIKCPCCNQDFRDYPDLIKHMKSFHMLTIPDWFEINIFKHPGKSIIYLDNKYNYQQPDWDKIGRYGKKQAISTVQDVISDYYGMIRGDRFFQLFIIDDIYFNSVPSHDFTEFKEVLKKFDSKDRNKIWFIDFKPGYPRIIDLKNLDGLKIVDIDKYYKLENLDTEIKLNDYSIKYPEIVSLDSRHYYKFNILNESSTSQVKKLRLRDTDKCIRFFNNSEVPEVKSIFKIFKSGVQIDNFDLIPNQDYIVLKLVLLRNKKFVKLIFDVLESSFKTIRDLRDSVFLRNTVTVNPDNQQDLSISWLPEWREDYLNISIL